MKSTTKIDGTPVEIRSNTKGDLYMDAETEMTAEMRADAKKIAEDVIEAYDKDNVLYVLVRYMRDHFNVHAGIKPAYNIYTEHIKGLSLHSVCGELNFIMDNETVDLDHYKVVYNEDVKNPYSSISDSGDDY